LKKKISFFDDIMLCFKNPSYRILFFSQILFHGSNLLTNVFLPIYLKYISKINKNIQIFNYQITPTIQISLIITSFFLMGIFFSGI
jgi:hypothetical protein